MDQSSSTQKSPRYVTVSTLVLAGLLALSSLATLVYGVLKLINSGLLPITDASPIPLFDTLQPYLIMLGGVALGITALGIWKKQNWGKLFLQLILAVFVLVLFFQMVFAISSEIFAGKAVLPLLSIAKTLGTGLGQYLLKVAAPVLLIIYLARIDQYFDESIKERKFLDQGVKSVLLATAMSCIIIVILIFLFTIMGAMPAIQKVGVENMLLGTIWRPGVLDENGIGNFGILPMILGSLLSTFGALVIGVPLSLGTAILLAEIAPPALRNVMRAVIELLAGIPSVVFGLFGIVVIAPIIRQIEIPYNTGFGILNASIILAMMIIPTITSIAEDAIRAVPAEYKSGSLALGISHWQSIIHVILPAARSGIIAAIILGIGRALGETMALIMVIGNSIAIPKPLTDNPLTIFLSMARTLTGNIAVEINYAADVHRSALFFTGVLLFLLILLVNSISRLLMRNKMEFKK